MTRDMFFLLIRYWVLLGICYQLIGICPAGSPFAELKNFVKLHILIAAPLMLLIGKLVLKPEDHDRDLKIMTRSFYCSPYVSEDDDIVEHICIGLILLVYYVQWNIYFKKICFHIFIYLYYFFFF